MDQIKENYNLLWQMIIRPPRDEYELSDFGPARFRIGEDVFARTDLQLRSPRGHRLECSHFRQCGAKAPPAGTPLPTVIYLHGNCSSRLEACDVLPVLLPRGVTVFCMDMSGSGLSEGEYISLGYHEHEDVKVAVAYLRDSGAASAVGLWGRSMGAVTSVLRAAEDPTIAGCVIDSPFGSLRQVAEELVNSGAFQVPWFLLSMVIQVVRGEVQTRADFDIEELLPIERAPRAKSPVIFATATDDNFVLPHHTQDLHAAWGGDDCHLETFEGGHNGQRPMWFLERAADFLADRLSRAQDGRPAPDLIPAPPGSRRVIGTLGKLPPSTGGRPVGAPSGAPAPSGAAAAELSMMGFSDDLVAEALRRHSTVEAAVEWIMQISQGTHRALEAHLASKPPNTGRPATLRHLGGADPAREAAEADAAEALRDLAAAAARSAAARDVAAKAAAEQGASAPWKRPQVAAPGVPAPAPTAAPASYVRAPTTAVPGPAPVGPRGPMMYGDPGHVPGTMQPRYVPPSGPAIVGTQLGDLRAPHDSPPEEFSPKHRRSPTSPSEAQTVEKLLAEAGIPTQTQDVGGAQPAQNGQIVQELLALGVPPPRAEEAARRCSTVEAAVDWLVASGNI